MCCLWLWHFASMNSGRPCHSRKDLNTAAPQTHTHVRMQPLAVAHFLFLPLFFSCTVVCLCVRVLRWKQTPPGSPTPRGEPAELLQGGEEGQEGKPRAGWAFQMAFWGGWKHSSLTVFFWAFVSLLFSCLLSINFLCFLFALFLLTLYRLH